MQDYKIRLNTNTWFMGIIMGMYYVTREIGGRVYWYSTSVTNNYDTARRYAEKQVNKLLARDMTGWTIEIWYNNKPLKTYRLI